MRSRPYNKVEKVIAESVAQTRQPSIIPRESGAGRGAMATHEDSATVADGDGYTIHGIILDLDVLDDTQAVLG